jgi:hypothetical protein
LQFTLMRGMMKLRSWNRRLIKALIWFFRERIQLSHLRLKRDEGPTERPNKSTSWLGLSILTIEKNDESDLWQDLGTFCLQSHGVGH